MPPVTPWGLSLPLMLAAAALGPAKAAPTEPEQRHGTTSLGGISLMPAAGSSIPSSPGLDADISSVRLRFPLTGPTDHIWRYPQGLLSAGSVPLAQGSQETITPAEGETSEPPQPAQPESTAQEDSSLAVKLQNPIANLISVPFQFNVDTGIGPDENKERWLLNIQPVVPFELNERWNLISRTILPVVYAEGPATGINSAFGIGDTVQSLFFSPVKPVGGWILGAGPVMALPTGSNDLFRSKQFSLGPTAVGLRQQPLGNGTVTYGMLANHLWKVAGSDDAPDTNATFLQPFLGYTTKAGTSFFLNTETTYNWTLEDWSVPLNASIAHVFALGKQPVQVQFGGRYYLDTLQNGPRWGLRLTVTLLFPN